MRYLYIVFGMCGLACSVEPVTRAPLGSARQAIVGGSTDTGHPAVGFLHSGGSAACTATLIDKRTVLTAAHCVLDDPAPYTLRSPVHFYLGGPNGVLYPAVSVATHPNYAGGNKSDVAVVRLLKDVPTAPMPLASTAPTPGETVTIVGYGLEQDGTDTSGVKRKGTTTINQVGALAFIFNGSGTGATVCSGDSGGPTLALRGGKETVIGVHSTTAPGCNTTGTDMRVDAYLPWIQQQLSNSVYGSPCQGAPECLSTLCLQSGTNSFCSQECDSNPCPFGDQCVAVSGGSFSKACLPNSGVGPKALGAACQNPLDCASQICVPLPQKGSFCSEQCDTQQKNCPAGFTCVASGTDPANTNGLCIATGGKAVGDSCSDNFDCQTLVCVFVPLVGQRCSQECDPQQSNCPTGYVCATTTAGGGLCVEKSSTPPDPLPPPDPPPTVKKNDGELCAKQTDCQSNICGKIGDAFVCLRPCNPTQPDCPGGFRCAELAGQPGSGACVEHKAALGASCQSSADCLSELCGAAGDGKRFCSQLCDPAKGCPTGFDCVPAGEQHACSPSSTSAPSSDAGPGSDARLDSGGGGDSGCAIGGDPPGPLLLLLLPALAIRRRRR